MLLVERAKVAEEEEEEEEDEPMKEREVVVGGGRGGRLKLESSSRKWWEGRKIGINGGTTTIRDGPIGKERRGSIRFRLAPSCGNETHRPLSPLSSLFDLRDRPPRPQLL